MSITVFKTFRRTRGYTLLEMGIVFTVVGIFLAAAIQGYNIYVKKRAAEITERNTYTVVTALNNYLMQQGRYPCPAPLNAARDSATYGFGIAGNLCATDPAALATSPCGDTTGADCTMFQGAYKLAAAPNTSAIPLNSPNQRQVNIVPRSSTNCRTYVENPPGTWGPADPAGPDSPADCRRPSVWHGVVPFRELGVPESVAEDGYGARLVYAVSENLTDVQTYRKDGGVISVVDEENNALVNPQGSAHFVVLSNGPDKTGAYSRTAALMGGPRARIDTTMDALNNPATPGRGRGVATSLAGGTDNLVGAASYRQARTARGDNVAGALERRFDDFVRFYSSAESPLWKVANASGTNITDLAGGGPTSRSKVGVGYGDGAGPTGSFDVGSGSAIFADDGFRAKQICSENGLNCILVDQIGGDPGISCPSGQFVTRIHGVSDQRLELACTNQIAMSCPRGYLLQGIDGAGVLTCEPISSCPPVTVTMCTIAGVPQYYTLPVGVQGQVHTSPVFGDSKTKTYMCNAGAWAFQSQAGVCECVPVNEQRFEICTDNSVREGFWDGTAVFEFTRVCPGGIETTVPISPPSTACTCRVGNENGTRSCPEGLPQGSINVKRDWQCNAPPNNTPPSGGSWVNPPTGGPQYTPVDPAQPQWYIASNTCRCVPGSQNRNRNCSDDLPGWTGQYPQSRDLTCDPDPTIPGVYSPWAPVATLAAPQTPNCQCSPYSEDLPPQNCPAGQLGTISKRKYLCCNPAVDPEPGIPGNQCDGVSAGAWSPEFTINNTCAVASYQWTDIGSTNQGGGGYTNAPFPRQIGDPCTEAQNPPNGDALQCTQFEGGGQYRIVNCRCQ